MTLNKIQKARGKSIIQLSKCFMFSRQLEVTNKNSRDLSKNRDLDGSQTLIIFDSAIIRKEGRQWITNM